MNRFFSNYSNFVGGFNGGVSTGGWGGNTQTLPSLNTQPMDYRNMSWGYGTGGQGSNPYVQFRPDIQNGAIGFGFNNGNTGWERPYANKRQPYNNFLISGFNPGYEQYGVLGTRLDRQERTRTIDSIGQVGFWQASIPGYPLSLYVG